MNFNSRCVMIVRMDKEGVCQSLYLVSEQQFRNTHQSNQPKLFPLTWTC